MQLLAEVGPDRLSIDAVAREAGVGKMSIYRRYATKTDLIIRSLQSVKSINLEDLPNADILTTIMFVVERFLKQYNNPLGRRMISLLITTLACDPQLSEQYWKAHSLSQLTKIRSLLKEFQEKGELSASLDCDLASDILVSYITNQFLMKPDEEASTKLLEGIKLLLSYWQ